MKFRARGVDRKTGAKLRPIIVEGIDERAAIAAANTAGMLVEGIDPLTPPEPIKVPAPLAAERPRRFHPALGKFHKYASLSALANIYAVLGTLCAAVAGLGAIYGAMMILFGIWRVYADLNNEGVAIASYGVVVLVACTVGGILVVVSLFAISEFIKLVLQVEETLQEICIRLAKPREDRASDVAPPKPPP